MKTAAISLKKILLALLLALLVTLGALAGGMAWLDSRLGNALHDRLPALLAVPAPGLHAGGVSLSLRKRQVTLHDLTLTQTDGSRLHLARLTATLDSAALCALRPLVPLPRWLLGLLLPPMPPALLPDAPAAPRPPLPLLADVEATGLSWQTAAFRCRIQRAHIARLSLDADAAEALLAGQMSFRHLPEHLHLHELRCRFLALEQPSLLRPVHVSLQELHAEALHQGIMQTLRGTALNVRDSQADLACREVRHSALSLPALLAAREPKEALLAALDTPAATDRPLHWSVSGLTCLVGGQTLLDAQALSRDERTTDGDRREQLRLDGARLHVPALAALLGLSLPGQDLWSLDGSSERCTQTGGDSRLRVMVNSTPASLRYTVRLHASPASRRWSNLDLTLDDRGLLALWALNCPGHDPLAALQARLPDPLPPDILRPLRCFAARPGSLHLTSTTPGGHAPLWESPSGWAQDVRLSVQPGPDFLREQIDRLLQMQK